ncbi:SCO family protein [Bacteroidota bacterium]
MKNISMVLFLAVSILLQSCGDDLPVIDDFGESHYKLLTQDSTEVIFPDFVKGQIAVIGYIFTNCPDICPLTTNNMRRIQQRANEEGLRNIRFVSISFDPEVDRPGVLKRYAKLRRLDESNWTFLTGEKEITDSLIKQVGVVAFPGDSTATSDGEMIYFYVHTDRISVIDAEGRIRKNYLGSIINIEEIISDLKLLVN